MGADIQCNLYVSIPGRRKVTVTVKEPQFNIDSKNKTGLRLLLAYKLHYLGTVFLEIASKF